MDRTKKLCGLLGVLVIAAGAAFAVTRYEEKKEEIKTSGETILSIDADSVTALSWDNGDAELAFLKDEDGNWSYDGDAAFPVDPDKIAEKLSPFAELGAAFAIENADDLSLYGLDHPVCTISLTADGTDYEILLGDFSKMDSQRYVSIGDGNVYLVTADPMEEYDAVLRDMILNDKVPYLTQADSVTFSGSESYTLTYEEDSSKTYCADDIYFANGKPLDTDRVKAYLRTVGELDLTDYASYNASEDELASWGLDTPAITVTIAYTETDEDTKEETAKEVSLSLGQNREELAAREKAEEDGKEEDELPDVTAYARIGDSPIVYEIPASDFKALTAASYDDLRHEEIFSGAFSDLTEIAVTLEGETYTFTHEAGKNDADTGTWYYGEEELDIDALQTALTGLKADTFTEEKPDGKEEIALTLSLDNENFPTVKLALYRYDGEDCLAVADGTPVALVAREKAVDLIESVNQIVLTTRNDTAG